MPTISLPDGRLLDVAVSGPAGGVPLVFHHGTPGSLLPYRVMERAAHERGLRLVCFSRAGYGGSTRRPGRRVADATADVAALLDYLDVRRCLVAGWSGGGPHALACGAGLRERVAGVLVIAGVAPYDGPDWVTGMGELNLTEFGLAVQGEAALRPFVETAAPAIADITIEGMVEELSSLLPPADVAAVDGEFGADTVAQMRESVRVSGDGWIDDDLAFVTPWGFEPDEVQVPTFLWQGTADVMVPPSHGHRLATAIPTVTPHFEPDEGHLSIGVNAMDRMLDELVTTL